MKIDLSCLMAMTVLYRTHVEAYIQANVPRPTHGHLDYLEGDTCVRVWYVLLSYYYTIVILVEVLHYELPCS